MRPGNFDIFRDSAVARGVAKNNRDLAWASGRFQLACYKEEIEANLRTPGLAGFQLLDLHDYVGQGTALVGLLDPFWEAKSYVTADEFRRFCDRTVPLARLRQRVFTTDDRLEAEVELAHYGAHALTNFVVSWEIRNSAGAVMTRGEFVPSDIPIGRSRVGKISFDLLKLPAPAAYRLVVTVAPRFAYSVRHAQNDWNFWLYPARDSKPVPTNVFVTSSWDEAEAKLSNGGRVLFLPRNTDLDWSCPPLDDVPIFWNRLMNPGWSRMLGLWCDTNHPALAGFPTEPNCDWQWTQIVRGVRPMNLEKLPRDLQPIVQAIDDWNRNWKLGAIFECKVGRGQLLVSTFDLTSDLRRRPVARQLCRSLLDYMASERFQPEVEVAAAEVRPLLFDTQIMRKLGARALGERGAANAIDGDPNTAWMVGGRTRNASGGSHPHALALEFPQPVQLSGLMIMPRQNDRDHSGDVREFELESSDDGVHWTSLKRGSLASTWNPQRVELGRVVSVRHLRFTAVSGFGNDTSAALGELAVLYAGPKLEQSTSGNIEFRRSRSTSADVDEGTPLRPDGSQ
jgi:beta-galactosidase